MIERHVIDGVDVLRIDYRDEDGPFWYVVVDDTPLLPECPLPLDAAVTEFRKAVEEADPDEIVELRQCTDEQIEWSKVKADG